MREILRPIEAGCAVMVVRGHLAGRVATAIERAEYDPDGCCATCRRPDRAWLLRGIEPHDGACECALVRIDPDDDQRAEWGRENAPRSAQERRGATNGETMSLGEWAEKTA